MAFPCIVIAGPTASGKSALALAAARAVGGVVINADSMQVYRDLRVLTARPGAEDEALAPHRLYGILAGSDLCSAGRWRALAAAECQAAWQAGQVPIVTGGTGLYLRALISGLSPVPEVPDAVRLETRALFARLGNAAFHARLAAADPVMAARLDPGNSQRLMRAWEVLAATGRSLAAWQALPPEGGLDADVLTLVLDPPRPWLYASCDRRFLMMLEQGALDEVRGLAGLDPALPVLKALGVPELRACLAGHMTLDQATAAAQQATRNFAKRQLTWFRHQMPGAHRVAAQFSESLCGQILSIIRQFLLTRTG